MAYFEKPPALPDDFSGPVRLFPLPNLVMFPGVVQPLHIFEPRYVAMLEDALADDKLIAMALLAPGWEENYDGRPSIDSVVCLGQVMTHSRDEQGRYNILLLGMHRAEIMRELPPDREFRTAHVDLLRDYYPAAGDTQRGALQRRLLEAFQPLVSLSPAAGQQFQQLLSSKIPLGMLTDIVASTIGFDLPVKLELLSECNVDRRAEMLIERVAAVDEAELREFPPKFSDN